MLNYHNVTQTFESEIHFLKQGLTKYAPTLMKLDQEVTKKIHSILVCTKIENKDAR